MSIKLVAIDLDDTLLDSGLKISEKCINAIQQVQQKGILVTLATGRMFRSALPYANELQMDIPLITYQGALVKNSLSQETLYYKPVPGELGTEAMQYFAGAGVHYQCYFGDQLCMESLSAEGRFYSELAGIEPLIIADILNYSKHNEALKILAVSFDEKLILDMEKHLNQRFGSMLNITRSKPYFLEIMNRSANKGIALKIVADHYNIAREEVLAVGDSYNDLNMLEWAGTGIAMGNAPDVVKAAADFVTLSNEEEGVAEALINFVLN
ncbi:MAG: Cof-type HAD-IIB family hydrolase [Syntrophomonadaceae bacterium]|nr:Cof-type HAD-IIB family hydrolase [Syntrophomonadaceae bacterium]MDD3024166.1 Cof-type HAD-IIB family hydrolase [Syntrophomonadaceae bacterium]